MRGNQSEARPNSCALAQMQQLANATTFANTRENDILAKTVEYFTFAIKGRR
jgi:hypothetical protein